MKDKITCIIVDDEKQAREGLAIMVGALDDIELIDTCRDGIEAIYKLNEFRPDLLLLDIQMPNINGFEVLKHIKQQPAAIIFITAYDQYAIKAFEVHAVDYLLKPFSDDRFYEAMKKAREKIRFRKGSLDLPSFLSDTQRYQDQKDAVIYDKGAQGERMVVKADGDLHFVPLTEIRFIEAYDYYIKIHVNKSSLLVRETMKNILKKLPEHQFVRIHKSSIVNLEHVERIEHASATDVRVVLRNSEELKVSRTYKSALLERFS